MRLDCTSKMTAQNMETNAYVVWQRGRKKKTVK